MKLEKPEKRLVGSERLAPLGRFALHILFALVVLAFLLFFLWGLVMCFNHLPRGDYNWRINQWAAKCRADGGIVSQTKWADFATSEQVECFKDGKIINHED